MKRAANAAALLVGSLILAPAVAFPGSNPYFTIPLHAVTGIALDCRGYLPVDCKLHRPTVDVPGNTLITVFFFLANYDNAAAFAAAVEWDPSWTHGFEHWNCLYGQLEGIYHNSGNTAEGAMAFNCVTGQALTLLGHMVLTTGSTGCLRFIQPSLPFGTHLMDCAIDIDQILDVDSPRLGRVCVGTGGRDACDRLVPTEAATWGRIKRSYK